MNGVGEEAKSQRDITEHQDVGNDDDAGVLRGFELDVVFHRALSKIVSFEWDYLARELNIHHILEHVYQVLIVANALHGSVHSVIVIVVHGLVKGLEVTDKNLALPFLCSCYRVIVFLKQKGDLHTGRVDQTSLAKSLRASLTSLSTKHCKRQDGSANAVETNAARFVGIWNALRHGLRVEGLAD